ncbi:MAG TPA: hypothetical protein VNR70_00110, partial [Steroidobacteraceae bacterium]|nr:hypothetical protein [Steroidobacteraceae bacterium]
MYGPTFACGAGFWVRGVCHFTQQLIKDVLQTTSAGVRRTVTESPGAVMQALPLTVALRSGA